MRFGIRLFKSLWNFTGTSEATLRRRLSNFGVVQLLNYPIARLRNLIKSYGKTSGPRWIPAQRSVTRSFDVFFDLCLNKRLSKQWWGWWFETLSHPLWRHSNVSFKFREMRENANTFVFFWNKVSTTTYEYTTMTTFLLLDWRHNVNDINCCNWYLLSYLTVGFSFFSLLISISTNIFTYISWLFTGLPIWRP